MKRKQTSTLHALVNNKMKINLKVNEPDENYSESTDIVSSWGSFGVLVRMLYNKLFILKIHFHLLVLCHMKVFQNLVQQSASLFFTFSPEKNKCYIIGGLLRLFKGGRLPPRSFVQNASALSLSLSFLLSYYACACCNANKCKCLPLRSSLPSCPILPPLPWKIRANDAIHCPEHLLPLKHQHLSCGLFFGSTVLVVISDFFYLPTYPSASYHGKPTSAVKCIKTSVH